MAIVQLKSANPQFTFLIKKNPNSGMQLRSIRKGMAYGWYSDESTYNVYFKDADNEISYKQHENEHFEYLNVSRYNTPLFPLNAINEFFNAPLKRSDDELDLEGYDHSLFINMIHIEMVRYIDFFQKHLPDFTFHIQHRSHKSYALTVTTRRSLYQLLHVTSVLCLFLSMLGNEYIDISDSILDKYIKSLNIIDAPFYIRSLFARNFLSSRQRFNKYKSEIEKTRRYDIRLDYGGTAFQRRNYIGGVLPLNKSLVDIGCGEGFYAIPFAKKMDHSYYAIDTNEEILDALQRKAIIKEIDNISTYPSLDQFLGTYNGELVDVIMTEVIEHMSENEAKDLIQHVCRHVNYEHFIITTPNADFNTFYELDGFRHDDHKWEMGQERFRAWFLEFLKEMNLHYEFVAIGDSVNQVSTTQGIVLKKRGD
ncbi:class I SAM-dependent methyltransferase [Paenibacillus sp. ACRRX]|uniref:class I SAM-dependent methyltransferase n=1 Tax=Paenibacillus sp. ACRRX TaxID=2918206 RepID=UPI001EF5E421|nr:class I SAM-dependent methyltransferase [Paenibacillus sp. ACRRX]MCG7408960.1 class I SAM-dependent methyltransferase [Paenibacillus sp. ACRRX]